MDLSRTESGIWPSVCFWSMLVLTHRLPCQMFTFNVYAFVSSFLIHLVPKLIRVSQSLYYNIVYHLSPYIPYILMIFLCIHKPLHPSSWGFWPKAKTFGCQSGSRWKAAGSSRWGSVQSAPSPSLDRVFQGMICCVFGFPFESLWRCQIEELDIEYLWICYFLII